MTAGRYRATINGFWCHNETWDDALNWDGKHDEVLLAVNTKVAAPDGTIKQNVDGESELMGDTWRLPNRVQAGSASDRGGIVTGDKFPAVSDPWRRTGVLDAVRCPPYTIWEGDLSPGGDVVLLTPTIWEWDPGAGFWDGWLDWQVKVDNEYGKRAKDIVGKVWPVTAPIFDAVSLGIQTVGTLAGLWSPLGKSMRRPIGIRRDPADPDGFLFDPITIALTDESAAYLAGTNLQGLGAGVVELRYADDPYLRGVYSIFVQVERLSGGALSVQRDWRWCDRCQGLYFGPQAGVSRCPAGGTHTPADQSHSGDYALPHNAPVAADRQSGWRWCDKCQGLFFGPGLPASSCPAGGTHADPAVSGSGDYSPFHDAAPDPGRQAEWRWCDKCQGMFFGPGLQSSSCPAGGTHQPPALSRSGNYSLPHTPAV